MRRSMHGHALVEYLVVLLGLAVVWAAVDIVLTLLREHQNEFTWALSLPL